MSGWKYASVAAVLLAIAGSAVAVRGEILGDYLGYTACEPCHFDIVEKWKETGHARAFESLKTQGEEKQENPGCVECHVVAYGQDGGFIDMDLTPELTDIQCESCHGPGKKHSETLLAEDIVGNTGEEVCRKCHTEGQDKDFDFAKKSQLAH